MESGGESDCRDEMDECCQCNEHIAHSLDFGCGKWAIDAAGESDAWEFQAGHIRDGSDAHLADGMPRRVRVTVKTINGPREWYIDTAADSIWFSMEEFVRVGGAQFVRNSECAESADGSPLAAIGRGVVTFSLWGRLFRKMPVRIMANLPSGVLLGNKFLVGGLGMTMNLRSVWGKFTLPLGDRPLTYSSRIDMQVKVASAEELAAVIGEDIDGIIGTLDLTHFGNGPSDAERLRTLMTKY
jgi:hypothetical protein